MTFSTYNRFIQKNKSYTINVVRVCVKASPAEGRRRLHTNTAYARLSGFNKLSPAEGRRRLHTNTAYARLSGFNKLS